MKSFVLILLLSRALFAAPPTDAEIRAKVKAKLQAKQDHTERTLTRIGDRTLQLEVFIATPGNLKMATEIFKDWQHYSDWALKGINQRPTGGEYYMQILGMNVSPKDKTILQLNLFLNFPVFTKKLEREFRMTVEEVNGVLTVDAEAVKDNESVIGASSGFLKIFQADGTTNQLWVYVSGLAQLKNWLLYEALPEKLLTRESGDRIQIVMDNYIQEEDRRLNATVKSLATSDRIKTPKKKR